MGTRSGLGNGVGMRVRMITIGAPQQNHRIGALHRFRDPKLAYASVNQASCAFRFLYRRVLGRPEAGFDIPMAKVPKRLP